MAVNERVQKDARVAYGERINGRRIDLVEGDKIGVLIPKDDVEFVFRMLGIEWSAENLAVFAPNGRISRDLVELFAKRTVSNGIRYGV